MPTQLKQKPKSKQAAKTKTAAAVKKSKPAKAKMSGKTAKTKVVGALAKAGKALAAKLKKVTKPLKKPHKPPHAHPMPDGDHMNLPSGGTFPGGAPATPQIDAPLANALIAAATNLNVDCTTNRADLRYVLDVADVTPSPGPGPLPLMAAPLRLNATPVGNNFSFVVPGGNLVAARVYRLRVLVNPNDAPTPPHTDFVISVNS